MELGNDAYFFLLTELYIFKTAKIRRK
jgi:hypothetical protein